MSNDCKDTLQIQNKTVRVRRSRTSKVSEQSIYQIQTAAEPSESGKLWANSSIFSWCLKDASEDNEVRDAGKNSIFTYLLTYYAVQQNRSIWYVPHYSSPLSVLSGINIDILRSRFSSWNKHS